MPIPFHPTERSCKNILLFIWSSGECTGRHQTLNLDLCIAFRLISTQILSGIWPRLGLGSIGSPIPKLYLRATCLMLTVNLFQPAMVEFDRGCLPRRRDLDCFHLKTCKLQSLNFNWRSGPTLQSDHGHVIVHYSQKGCFGPFGPCLAGNIHTHTSNLSRVPRVYPCKFFLAGVNFYRLNVKNWHFWQILREKWRFLQI